MHAPAAHTETAERLPGRYRQRKGVADPRLTASGVAAHHDGRTGLHRQAVAKPRLGPERSEHVRYGRGFERFKRGLLRARGVELIDDRFVVFCVDLVRGADELFRETALRVG